VRRNRPNPHGTRRRKLYDGPARPVRVEGNPTRQPVDRNHRVRLVAKLQALKANLPRRKGTQGPIATSVLNVYRSLLFDFLNVETGRCDPSVAAIHARTGISEPTIERGMLVLEAIGFVRRHPRWVVYALGEGYTPCTRHQKGKRHPRGTEIRVEDSYAYTFPSEDELDRICSDYAT